MIEELTGKCRSQEGKMEQLKGFEAERRKYEVRQGGGNMLTEDISRGG